MENVGIFATEQIEQEASELVSKAAFYAEAASRSGWVIRQRIGSNKLRNPEQDLATIKRLRDEAQKAARLANDAMRLLDGLRFS